MTATTVETEARAGHDRPEPITSVRFIAVELSEAHYDWKQYGTELRVVYDPTRTSYLTIRGALLLEFGGRIIDLTPPTAHDTRVLDEDGLPLGAARITSDEDGGGTLLGAHLATFFDGTQIIGVDGKVMADLDVAGARRLRASVAAFLPQLDAMIDTLAATETDAKQVDA